MKKITLLITILLLAGLVLVGGGCRKDSLDDSVSIETKITNAINQAQETGEIVLTEEIRTPPYWISISINSIAEKTGLNSNNICFAVIGNIDEEWPAFLERTGFEVQLIMANNETFETVCGYETDELKRKLAEKHEILEFDFRVLKIEECCNPIEGEKCLLVLIR